MVPRAIAPAVCGDALNGRSQRNVGGFRSRASVAQTAGVGQSFAGSDRRRQVSGMEDGKRMAGRGLAAGVEPSAGGGWKRLGLETASGWKGRGMGQRHRDMPKLCFSGFLQEDCWVSCN